MDLAVTLIKSVLRAFYPTRDILVMDALILHEAYDIYTRTFLRDDDLAYLMAINTKDLHKICGKLREDRFLTVHTRSELRDGNPRPSNRTWYYINYRHTIDAIKWRVYTIDKEVQGAPVPANEKKEYFCSFCKAEWTAMEVLDSVGPNGFLCHRCHHTLTFEADRTSTGHEQSTRLNDQFKFISELLPKIDAVHIPECDFDRALAKARPVVRDATHQRAATIPVESGLNRPMAVKGLTNTGPQSIAVNISTSDGPSAAEKEAEKARKEKIAQQNALPSWMSNSTVTGESFSGTLSDGLISLKQDDESSAALKGKKVDANTSAKIDDIFEKLKAEQAAEMAKGIIHGGNDEDFDSEEDDGYEDEFEDVPATGNTSGLGTPSTAAVKREVSTILSRDGDSADERAPKKVKVDQEIKKESEGLEGDDDTGDEDEDMEFEDI
ncbi:transcription factor spTFIIE alpha subunit [Metarhizium acridum CQMa 102]|uniref:Transcription factor spTFIIE alpha subunit n=1 Tax=Metarhizium acridum (strain CQMa 102) TaxID=655827 RepID=E9E992_METAQ|nr:transcription factor spTFIIE alpha subunit [Metarhizium acridum CQMa 102]EFY87463.1 transcription factor spTFIIE alpha subunit [Metarhizium acridum CQMa 102]